MRTRNRIVFLLISTFLGIGLLYAQNSAKLNLTRLYGCWFESPYEYMFVNSDEENYPGAPRKTVTIKGKEFGMFTAGPGGLLYYGGLASCAGKYLGIDEIKTWRKDHIEELAGLQAFRSPGMRGAFPFYNSMIIKWGAKTLIPAPDKKIDGVKFQTIYNVVFSRLARLMTESYLLLNNRRNFKNEQFEYLRSMASVKNFDGETYLKTRYKNELSVYAYADNGTAFLPSNAIGFWLRRGIDSTDGDIWNALGIFMKKYDQAWYFKTKKLYNKKARRRR